MLASILPALFLLTTGCKDKDTVDTQGETGTEAVVGHGPMAENVYGQMGDPWPFATAEQLETYERGLEVANRRFSLEDGLGPAFNLTFCGGCHERPVIGGSAGLYRSFFLSGVKLDDGSFFAGESAGSAGGVIRLYYYGDEYTLRPEVPAETNVIAQRNAIPFFGVGLIAELEDAELLSREDPDDLDGDGISGRANYDQGFVGRFGRKSQTVSIEGFIRGPLFNHLGITTDPLTEEQKAALPIDSSSASAEGDTALGMLQRTFQDLHGLSQAAAAAGPLTDSDAAPDPELSTDDLFDLVSFSMLTAAPAVEEPGEQELRGIELFDAAMCDRCHTPRVQSPRGPLPIYSDLLLHDMGDALADGLEQGNADGNEYRTQPLWGLAAVGPYLHDGRATSIEGAILWHGGEAQRSRDIYAGYSDAEKEDVLAFLTSLGGRDQYSPGLLPPGEPVPGVGEYGGPYAELSSEDMQRFEAGRAVFDHEFGVEDGLGAPRFNGDSCRACHFDPVIGGSGPRGVNVMRHGILGGDNEFTLPAVGSILHRMTSIVDEHANAGQDAASIYEHRQTPHLFGLGLIDAIPEGDILAGADPYDLDGDGISGKPSYSDGGALGRFGWKAQIAHIDEFVRDAVSVELGMTLSYQEGLTFGMIYDVDNVPDPEFADEDADLLEHYLATLAPPPRQAGADSAEALAGEQVFSDVGCALCHTPSFQSDLGEVAVFSDLLLHEIMPEGYIGVEEASATMREFRTSPLWGLSQTGPYLHSGAADTIEQAIEAHAGEAEDVVAAWAELSDADRAALLTFLETL